MPKSTGYMPLHGDDADDDDRRLLPSSSTPTEQQHDSSDGDDQSDEGGSGSNSKKLNSRHTGPLYSDNDGRHSPVTEAAPSATVATIGRAEATTRPSPYALCQGPSTIQPGVKGSSAQQPLQKSGSSSSLSNHQHSSSSSFRFPRLGLVSKHTSRPSFLTGGGGSSSGVYGSSPKRKSFLGRIERGSGNTSYSRISGEESLRSLLRSPSSSSGVTRRGLSLFTSKSGSNGQRYSSSPVQPSSSYSNSGGWTDLSNIRPKRHPYTTSSGPRGIQRAQKRQILREIRPDLHHLPEALLREQAKAGAVVEAQLRRGSMSLASESEWDDHMSSAETIDEGRGQQQLQQQQQQQQRHENEQRESALSPRLPPARSSHQQTELRDHFTGAEAGARRGEVICSHDKEVRDNLPPSLPRETPRYSTDDAASSSAVAATATPSTVVANQSFHLAVANPETTLNSDTSATRPALSTVQAAAADGDSVQQQPQQQQQQHKNLLGSEESGSGAAGKAHASSAPSILVHNVNRDDNGSGRGTSTRGGRNETQTRIRRQRRGGADKREDRVLQTSVFTPIEEPLDQRGQPVAPPPALTPDHAEPMTSNRFVGIVESVKEAIRSGIQPLRIAQGSSGSYFCRNSDGKIVGVFKPKNEEPYGQLNPKWAKWVHRNLFPCCFGRSCLIPNLGYISESAASLVDRRLKLNIVPTTEVVWLSSPAFHYDYLDRRAAKNSKSYKPLPDKVGSFQLFLNGFRDANLFMREHPWPAEVAPSHSEGSALNSGGKARSYGTWGRSRGDGRRPSPSSIRSQGDNNSSSSASQDPESASIAGSTTGTLAGWPAALPDGDGFRWTPQLQQQFREQFEKMILLDYLIRNTDRGLDNWMIRYCGKEGISIVAGSGVAASDSAPGAQKVNSRRGSRVGELLSSSFRSSTSSSRDLAARNNSMLATPPGTPPRSALSTSTSTSTSAHPNTSGNGGPSASGVELLRDEPETTVIVESTSSASAATGGSSSSSQTGPKTPIHRIEDYYGGSHVHIAAIDNGLAFPFKHPDSWRSYPYGWLFLPRSLINQPFTQATRDHFLSLLSDPQWWRETITDLQRLFKIDSDFDQRMFDKQMAVMKGQGWNIVETLKNPDHGPLDLCRRVAVVVWDEEVTIERRRLVTRDANGRVVRGRSSGDKHPSSLAPTVTTKLVSPGSQINGSHSGTFNGAPAEDYVSITIDPPIASGPLEAEASQHAAALTLPRTAFAEGVGPLLSDEEGERGETDDGFAFDFEDDGDSEDDDDDHEVVSVEDDDEDVRAFQTLPRRRRAMSQDGLLPLSPNDGREPRRRSRERGRQYRRALRKNSTSVDSGMAHNGGGMRRATGQQSLASAAQTLTLSPTTDGKHNQQRPNDAEGSLSSSLHVRRRTEHDDQMGNVGGTAAAVEGEASLLLYGLPETVLQPGSQNQALQHQQQQPSSRQIGFDSSVTAATCENAVHGGKKVSEEFANARRRWADRLRRGLSFDGQLLRGLDNKKDGSKKGKREVIKERRVIRVERIEAVTTKTYFTWW